MNFKLPSNPTHSMILWFSISLLLWFFFFLFTEKQPSYNIIHLCTEFVFAILGDADATLALHLMPKNIYVETF